MAASIRKAKQRKPTLYSNNDSEYHSVSIRKIDNGFLVNVTKSSGDRYQSNEEYHERRPKIDIQSIPNIGAKSVESKITVNALRKAAGNKKIKDT